ncbi:MAG: dihydrofolate reductase [Bacteroidales bacterium]|nr:dihydrofolate reductase [Bacteroidales bacterium]
MKNKESVLEGQHIFKYQDERFADLQLLRYRVDGFETLSLRQKILVWHLAEAALWGRDILWDQNGRYNLRIRHLLEGVYTEYKGDRRCEEFLQFETYLKRVWFSNGIHHHYATDKFQPGFTQQYLLKLIGECGMEVPEQDLLDVIFCPALYPKRVNQAKGEDLLLTSACNYYAEGVTQAEAEAFYEEQKKQFAESNGHIEGGKVKDRTAEKPLMFGMNSQLKRDAEGRLMEDVWKAQGMYGSAICHIIEHLRKAIPYAESEKQAEVIRTLVEFYETGSLDTFDLYTILWVQDTECEVDFTNGFTEVYGDPLGLKASWEGYVNFLDREATQRTERMSREAQWFEDNSPVDKRFKKTECRGVTAKVIKAAILGGDLYPSSAIGINLPNSNWVRETYGSKSVTIGNLTHAYDEAARGNGFREEFVIDEATCQLIDKYGNVCDDLHTDLHECLGHGSGRILPGVDPDALKAYGSTIEEARADLFALYFLANKKMVELNLTPNDEAYKASYYTYLMNGLLTQLVRIEPGNNIEEAHMRNRSLIAHWVLKHYPDAVALRTIEKEPEHAGMSAEGLEADKGGKKAEKHYLEVKDYELLRKAFGELLAEIQRIKSEGDYKAAMELVEKYGVKVDNDIHQEILKRYRALDLAPYKGFINPRYEVKRDAEGNIVDVTPHYDETYAQQMLRYSREYSCEGLK